MQNGEPNITMHIKNIFDEGELNEDSVCKDFLHTATAEKEYRKYQVKTLSPVEEAYLETIKTVQKQLEKKTKGKQ